MKRLFIFIGLITISIYLFAQSDSLQSKSNEVLSLDSYLNRASSSYENGDYAQAINDYESIISEYGFSSELYYNLGNSYFKNKDFSHAILNYERCLLYDPNNSDAKANLELSKMNCVDKIESIQPVIFKTWSNSINNLMSSNEWSIISIVLFLIFVICLFTYFFIRKVNLRKIGFFVGIISIILCLISINYANKQKAKILNRDNAIVISATITVKSSPADSGTQLFTIHEGLKVRVKSTLSGWSEIELSDGNVGWIPSTSIEII